MLLFIEDELSKIADSGRFNTSHVTLYLKSPVRDLLSRYRFNTSHVTLYLIPVSCTAKNSKFQYISCYSLSYVNKKDKSIIQMFQYISCYSLSNYTENIMEDKASFNTSHVTLYLRELGIAF